MSETPTMPQTVADVMAQAQFHTDNQDYTLLHLPPNAIMAAAGVVAEIGEPFCALVVDKDEVTLLIAAEALADFEHRLPGYVASNTPYRLITLDVVLEPDLIGLLAHVSAALAQEQISILAFAAYARDHFFVPATDLDRALATLRSLSASS